MIESLYPDITSELNGIVVSVIFMMLYFTIKSLVLEFRDTF